MGKKQRQRLAMVPFSSPCAPGDVGSAALRTLTVMDTWCWHWGHGIIESWVGRDSQGSSSSTSWSCTAPPQASHHEPETIIQELLKLCQVWCCGHFPGKPVLVPTNPYQRVKNLFLISNVNLPWDRFMLFPCVLSLDKREEVSSCPCTSPHKEAVGHNEVSPQSPPGWSQVTSATPQMTWPHTIAILSPN